MPLSTDQLRQLLTERSEPASYRPAPHERIRARIRRARIRRTAAAGLVATVAVVGGLSVAAALHQHSSDRAIAGGQQFPAPPAPQLPESYTGNNTTTGHGKAQLRKIASRSGDWPGGRTATFTVPFHGRNLDISTVCSGAIAGRLTVTMQVNGHTSSQLPCMLWASGKQPPSDSSIAGQAGKPITLTFRIQAPSPATAAAYAKRSASWTIAIYEEEF